MRIASLKVENVRSYRDPTTFDFGAHLNIFIGPNGGGKTNLLDTLTLVLLNFFFRWYKFEMKGGELNISSDALFSTFAQHLNRYDPSKDSIVTVEVLPESPDADNIVRIQQWLTSSVAKAHPSVNLNSIAAVPMAHIDLFREGHQLRFSFRNNSLDQPPGDSPEHSFLQYTNCIQLASGLAAKDVLSGLTLPLFPPVQPEHKGFPAQSTSLA